MSKLVQEHHDKLSIATLSRAPAKELARLLLEHSLHDRDFRKTLAAFAANLRDPTTSRSPQEQTYIVGNSPSMSRVFDDIRRYAPTDACVLIMGEKGTGRKLVARAVHQRSAWANGPFVGIHCGALPPTLIRSELFGQESGAFKRGSGPKIGRIETAEGGSIFFEAIEELPLKSQEQLLLFLQEHTIKRVRGSEPILVNTRVIAAGQPDLFERVRNGHFRGDLFHRLSGLTIRLPALRERGSDVQLLTQFFLDQLSRELGRPSATLTLSPAAAKAISSYAWPGNVNELIASLRHAVVMAKSPIVEVDALGLSPTDNEPRHSEPSRRSRRSRRAPAR